MTSVPVPARVDLWLVIATALAIGGFGALVAPLLQDATVPWVVRVPIGLFAFGTVAFSLGISLPVRYAFEGQGLRVRAGPFVLRFAYRDVRRCVRVISPLSGPAWSWVRVRLVFAGGGWIEVAPRDRDGFLAELARRAPHLKRDERGLVER